ncbi:hypothetical protein IPM09_05225 [Candidatus Saccharibacteria bacterium]|nr:MAG: hypothetical protein IPM09_05225 [Candidatus Saccharibacteria bacterium]
MKATNIRPITIVEIIYNPNSTGDGEKNAREFAEKLKSVGLTVKLQPTKHAGHAVTLAKAFADAHPNGMVISSSGDGGYHEVVNGVLSSKNPTVVTGVLPSGNANDHYHFVHHGDTIKRIERSAIDTIDIVQVTTSQWQHSAHSYVGLGMTPQIGEQLTKAKLNTWVEAWLVITHLFRIRSVKLKIGRKVRQYDHVVFSNTGRMSKYLTLATDAAIDDGLFEITRVKAGSLVRLLAHIWQAVTRQTDVTPRANRFDFTVLRATTIQLDGEVYPLAAGERVTVVCKRRMLNCIV